MAAVTLTSDRGIALQNQIAYGRGGIQNGTFNRRIQLSNVWGAAVGDLFLDGDGVSRLRFPPGCTVRAVGSFIVVTNANGVVAQVGAPAVFDHTFVTNAAGVTTITANVVAAGFTVTKTNIAIPGGGTEDVINIVSGTVGANNRALCELAISDQPIVAGAGITRQIAAVGLIQAGRY